jgi:tetratricopeptide (TPR) repeat protein
MFVQENLPLSGVMQSPAQPDDPAELANLEDLIHEEKFQQVEPGLRTYLTAYPGSWKACYFLGYVLFRERQLEESVKYLSKSLSLHNDDPEAHNLLGKCMTIVGRYAMAEREFVEAARLAPDYSEAHYNLGRVHSIRDDFPRAKTEFEVAIKLNPNYMEAYNALGFAVEALGDDNAAWKDYQEAIRLNGERNGNFDAPYVNLSGFCNRRNELDLALEYAHKALALNPQSDLAYFQIAKTCRTRLDWDGVVKALEKAISIRPRSTYYYVLATAYRKLGRTKESEDALAKFKALEKQAAELAEKIRETRRATSGLELRPQ